MKPQQNSIRVNATGGVTVSLSKKSEAPTMPIKPVTHQTQPAATPSPTTVQSVDTGNMNPAPPSDDDEDMSLLTGSDGTDSDPEYPEDAAGSHFQEEILGDTAQDPDSLDSDDVDSGVLEIYCEKCLRCNHLVPHADKKYNNCHFSKGNDRCPAASVQILIGIPLESIVSAFMIAEQTGDNARLGRLYAQLAEKPAWQQQRIQTALTERRSRALQKQGKAPQKVSHK